MPIDRSWRPAAVSVAPFDVSTGADPDPFARHPAMAAISALRTAGVDVKLTLEIATLDVAGGRSVIHQPTDASWLHSSGSPALRRPSNTGGRFGVCAINHLTVSLGLRRRASAKAVFASSILPSSA